VRKTQKLLKDRKEKYLEKRTESSMILPDLVPVMVARWKTFRLGLTSISDLLDGWLTDIDAEDAAEDKSA
jgi:hypothetical protein